MRAMTLNEVSQVYDARASIAFDGSTNRVETEQALELLKQIAPALDNRILDVGCGAGWLLAAAHDAGYRQIVGVDISARSLRRAANLCKSTNAVFILGAVVSVTPATFDAVTAFNACFGCFGPLGDQAFVEGIFRALTPGGQMAMSYVGPDAARRRVGDYRVLYGSEAEIVTSAVRLDADEQWLVVEQMIGKKQIGEERIAVLTADRVESILQHEGFDGVKHSDPLRRDGFLPFVDVVTAAKPL